MRALGDRRVSWQPSRPMTGGVLSEGPQGVDIYGVPQWFRLGDQARIRNLRELSEEYSNDPRLRWKAAEIVQAAGVAPRDYPAQARALLRWVQQHIYYTHEVREQLQTPWRTLQVRTGDCFAEDTTVLRDDLELVPIQDVKIGDRIWGKDRWSEVVNFWEKGRLAVTQVRLNNGSVLRLTEGHKVYVRHCEKHGPNCPDILHGRGNCKKRAFFWERIDVSELREGMELLQPDVIEREGTPTSDTEASWFTGAFIAEGWAGEYLACISGKDGHWKEATKHRAKAFAEAEGWNTTWNAKYLAVHGAEVAAMLGECGKGALNKQIPLTVLANADLAALDDGLKLDASQNTHGRGWTFNTGSRRLAIQYRVLQRMLGRSTSFKKVTNHGGFGSNPVFRVGVRQPDEGKRDKRLRVRAIHREAEEVPCYDIATDDHYVYLPEADCTVSNCDDSALLLASLAKAIGISYKYVLAGKGRNGQMVRWVEGEPFKRAQYFHIYVQLGWPFGNPVHWASAEPTLRGAPLGYDLVQHGITMDHHGRPSVPELAGVHNRGNGGVRPTYKSNVQSVPGFYGALPAGDPGIYGTALPSYVPQEPPGESFWQGLALRTFEAVVGAVAIYMVMRYVEKR